MIGMREDQLAYRNALSLLPAGVSIITTNGPAGCCGLTASAVCSVTDSPPTVLGCVNRSSRSHAVLKANGHLCINVLRGDQQELAEHFAGMTNVPMSERFEWPIWDVGSHGLPVLRVALLQLQGRIVDVKDVGTHSVFFVEIETIGDRREGDSLVYFSREFHRLGQGRHT
jgi:flavin reductase (NADH)